MLSAEKETVQTARASVSGSSSGTSLAPVGVSTERVDPATLQVIAELFPTAGGGVDFLARLLRLAMVKQRTQAGAPQTTVAEIRIASIRHLAALIGRSYEATEKYVRLFCALNLLTKTRENRLVVLHFALGCYIPPASLSQLDLLMIEARPKVASFAKQVKRRFLRLYGDSARETSIKACTASGTPAAEIQDVIQTLQKIMALPEARAVQAHLAALETRLRGIDGRPASETAGLIADAGAEQGGLDPETTGLPTRNAGHQSRPASETAGLIADAGAEQGGLDSETAGSAADAGAEQGRLDPETAGLIADAGAEQGGLDPETAGLIADAGAEQGRLDSETAGLIADAGAEEGRLDPETAGSGELSHVNVCIKTITEQINVNVGMASAYFRERFGESNNGFYHKLQKICARPEIWLAAALEVFVAMQREDNPPHHPGKYFFSRVCEMHHHGIPPTAQDLVQRYGELSYARLVEILRTSPPQSNQKSDSQTPGHQPRPTRHVPFALRLERNREISGMSLEDLDALQQEISECVELSGWISRRYRQADGSCALLVESSLRRQIWLYSPEHWHERLLALIPAHQRAELRPLTAKKHASVRRNGDGKTAPPEYRSGRRGLRISPH